MFKKLFKDDDKIVGLSGFKKEQEIQHFYGFIPRPSEVKLAYSTNYKKNLFVS